MGDPFGLEIARERQGELLREAEERRMAGALRKSRRGAGEDGSVGFGGIEVRWRFDTARRVDGGQGPVRPTLRG